MKEQDAMQIGRNQTVCLFFHGSLWEGIGKSRKSISYLGYMYFPISSQGQNPEEGIY